MQKLLKQAATMTTLLVILLGSTGCGAADAGETADAGADARGLTLRAPGAFDGYTLVAPYLSTTTYLLDMDGEVVHRWESDATPAGGAYLLDDGSLLRCADTENPRFRSNGTGGRIQLFTWDGQLLWDHLVSDDRRMQNHDFEPLPNGNVLVAAWEHRSRDEALAAGCDPALVDERGLWPCVLMEVEPQPPTGGRIVWEWNAWDHLIQDRDASKANHGVLADHPELLDVNSRSMLQRLGDDPSTERRAEVAEELRAVEQEMRAIGYVGGSDGMADDFALGSGPDFMHVNGVSYEPDLDLIALSCWETSEVLVIDHSTTTAEAAGHVGGRYGKGGDILYRWGNPQTYGAGERRDQQLFSQHDARWLAGPRLLVFNNDAGRADPRRRQGFSTVVEIVLPFDPDRGFTREPGRAFGPAEPAWVYRAEDPEDFYGSFISGAHRLPNGNTFICEGPRGRLFEVTPAGRTVWEYRIPFETMSVAAWWGRFGWDDMGMDMDDGGDLSLEDGAGYDDLMVPQAAFRATRLPRDHPGLAALRD